MANGVFNSSNPSIPAVSAIGTGGAAGIEVRSDVDAILAESPSGAGVTGASNSGNGVIGNSSTGIGVNAGSLTGTGILVQSGTGIGVFARSGATSPTVTAGAAQAAISAEGVNGVTGINVTTDSGIAVIASSNTGAGIQVTAALAAVTADSSTGPGVQASSETGVGVRALSLQGTGVHAIGGGTAPSVNLPVAAVFAEGGPGIGVAGTTESGVGVTANGGSAGVALQVIGKVQVQGNSVGSVTMAAGTKTLTVTNAAATAGSLICLTPLHNPQAFLWIGARSAGSFTIDASKALPTNVTIVFLIVN